MHITEAQRDMRRAYIDGAPGVLISGLVWCIAATVSFFISAHTGMLALFFGGMLIFPLSAVFAKLLKRAGKARDDNPLNLLAIESTFILFVGLFVAYVCSTVTPHWFYSVMLLMIGVRYLSFNSLYGNKIYWALGVMLMIVGGVTMMSGLDAWIVALAGGVLELVFGFIIVFQSVSLRVQRDVT